MKKIISNIVVAALSLVLLDLFISASKIVYPQPLVIDQEKGRVYKANSEFVSFSEGFFVGKTNEFQYLGKGYPPEREKDTLRIAIMGDSFIAGLQLFEEHHFRNLLEKALTEKLGKKVEVLNFGRGGFDFSSMYANYLNFISKYNPDLTIFFLSSNDFKFEPLPLVPYVALENGELKMNNNLGSESSENKLRLMLEPIREKSTILRLVQNCRDLVEKDSTPEILLGEMSFLIRTFIPAKEVKKEEKITKIGELSEKIISELGKISAEKKVKFAVAHYTTPGFSIERVREESELKNNLKNFTQSNGILFYDLSSPLLKLFNSGVHPNFWPGSSMYGHWNHKAHKTIAEFLNDKLSKEYENKIN